MRKFLTSILSCMLLCLGMFTFTACDTTPAVENISITTTPTKTTYVIGEQIDLNGGELSVRYTDGTTATLPLTVATPSQYTFSTAGDNIIITLQFREKLTTLGVSVSKRDIMISSDFAIPNANYTGKAMPVDLTRINGITLGADSTYTVEYKLATAQDSTYTTTAPIHAGNYTIRININGGSQFNDMNQENGKQIIEYYNILPTTLDKLSTLPANSGKTLEYNFSKYTNFTYGDSIDFSKCWLNVDNQGNTSFGEAPLPTEFANRLTYQYRLQGTTTWTTLSDTSIAMPAGEYEIRVSLTDVPDVADYSRIETFVVRQKQLIFGQDYNLSVYNSGANYPLAEQMSLIYNGTPYSLVVEASQNLAGLLELISVNYLDKDNNINSMVPVNAGTYTAQYTISAGSNYQVIHQSITYKIAKATIDLPTLDNVTTEFNGGSKPYFIDNLDTKLTYTVEYAPTSNTNLYTTTPPSAVGSYFVRITFAFIDPSLALNYQLPAQIQRTLTIN